MKKRWYKKSGIKGLLVLLTIFFVTVSCVGAGTSVVIMNKGVQPLDSKSYVDSQSFRDSVYNLSHTIVNAISLAARASRYFGKSFIRVLLGRSEINVERPPR